MTTTIIVAVFVVGYLCIALESLLKINKAAPALLMCVACWVLYAIGAEVPGGETGERLLHHLGETCEILFFLMGAMTIVEIIDANGGFNFVQDALRTTSKRKLLWRITFMTFILSATLDNLTTSIVMVMVLRKLVSDHKDRMLYAGMIILAANAGGAFSPIGDVTTIMLWIKGMITTGGVIKELLLPSVMAVVVPAFILQFSLRGRLEPVAEAPGSLVAQTSRLERNTVFFLGVGGLVSVPIFRLLTGLPPFMGILLVLGLLWTTTEIFCSRKGDLEENAQQRVTQLLSRIDMSTILFFLGILLAVATLQETGVLAAFGKWLNDVSGGNHYLVTGVVGVVSSIVDNVPLVAGCMDMYSVSTAAQVAADPAVADFAVDGIFWQLLAYCAGVGGSMLIIGSAAGVIVMGLEKISFGWYLRRMTVLAFSGYLCGMGVYWVEKALGL